MQGETSLEYGQKLRQKFEFFTNFQNFLKFPLKISPQNCKSFPPKAKFPGNEIPKFRIFSMHAYMDVELI